MRRAFRESIDTIKSDVMLKHVVEALERRDVESAISSLNIDRPAFIPLEEALRRAYSSGGSGTIAGMPRLMDRSGAEVFVRFDVRNIRAEQWLSNHSSNLVTNIIQDQRVALRSAIEAGYAQGQGPRRIALDLVGRINPATGRREGGVVGLTSQQERFVASARSELTSTDAAQIRNYLTRARRDKRFDTHVLRSINDGKAVPDDIVSRALMRYEDRLLELRGEMIARTETMQAVHAAKHEAFRQGLDKTGYTEADVTRTWRSAGDGRVRHTHAEMNGQQVAGLDTPFVSPSGALLRFPGDTAFGAGPDEIVGCRCDDEIDIDFSAGVE